MCQSLLISWKQNEQPTESDRRDAGGMWGEPGAVTRLLLRDGHGDLRDGRDRTHSAGH